MPTSLGEPQEDLDRINMTPEGDLESIQIGDNEYKLDVVFGDDDPFLEGGVIKSKRTMEITNIHNHTTYQDVMPGSEEWQQVADAARAKFDLLNAARSPEELLEKDITLADDEKF